ncbi:MAG: RNA polymerase sigma-70 factor (ECF subfamily) [Planctomycetota bacterium]|jgi:RNA polymerase sigma-70 factor (ECF subfamily)
MMNAKQEERRLVCAAQGGDHKAFAALAERYQAPLYRFLRLRTGNVEDAEELLQDSLLRAWTKLDLYDERWRFSTWLYTLASRLAVSKKRRAVLPSVGQEALEHCAEVLDPGAAVAAAEERDNLWALAAEVLTPDQRSAMWLRYGEGREPIEIARILSKRASSVRVLLFRARERLMSHMQSSASEAATARARRSLRADASRSFPLGQVPSQAQGL